LRYGSIAPFLCKLSKNSGRAHLFEQGACQQKSAASADHPDRIGKRSQLIRLCFILRTLRTRRRRNPRPAAYFFITDAGKASRNDVRNHAPIRTMGGNQRGKRVRARKALSKIPANPI